MIFEIDFNDFRELINEDKYESSCSKIELLAVDNKGAYIGKFFSFLCKKKNTYSYTFDVWNAFLNLLDYL